MNESRKVPNQSVERALRILLCFTYERRALGITEVSRLLECHKSTVSRIMSTLEQLGFVRYNKSIGKFELGHRIIELGNIALDTVDIRNLAVPHMLRLTEEYGETVHLGVLSNDEVFTLEMIEGTQVLRAAVKTSARAPLHCTAVGKALLAFLDEDEVQAIIERKGLEGFTPTTITSPEELMRELQAIRAKGYAVDNEEHWPGIRCVAAPILNHFGKIEAAISVSGPAVRIDEVMTGKLARSVVAAARAISRELGHNGTNQTASNT